MHHLVMSQRTLHLLDVLINTVTARPWQPMVAALLNKATAVLLAVVVLQQMIAVVYQMVGHLVVPLHLHLLQHLLHQLQLLPQTPPETVPN